MNGSNSNTHIHCSKIKKKLSCTDCALHKFKCNGPSFCWQQYCFFLDVTLEPALFSVYQVETGWLICCYVVKEKPEKDPLVSLHLHACRYGGRETGWVRTLCVWCPPLSVVAFWRLCTFVLWQVISIVSLIFTWWLNNGALKWGT